ncbi:hypothetical protein BKA81DRAFT_189656 [Phyllosticta paracitricarpa]
MSTPGATSRGGPAAGRSAHWEAPGSQAESLHCWRGGRYVAAVDGLWAVDFSSRCCCRRRLAALHWSALAPEAPHPPQAACSFVNLFYQKPHTLSSAAREGPSSGHSTPLPYHFTVLIAKSSRPSGTGRLPSLFAICLHQFRLIGRTSAHILPGFETPCAEITILGLSVHPGFSTHEQKIVTTHTQAMLGNQAAGAA